MLIVDKPMPTNCCECALDCCWVEGTMPFEYAEKRKPDCPIKGVLPEEHVDLIDRDEVKQKMIYYGFRAIDMTATEFCEDELQTVIAAERKDDEQADC